VKKRTVLVLFGGRSAEHEVSIRSATSVIEALDARRYDVVPMAITRRGRWLSPARSSKRLSGVARRLHVRRCGMQPGRVPTGVDVVFPVLHGPFGEDGTVQGLLELADVPYVGSGVAGSAVGMDKDLLKRIFRDAGLPLVDFVTVTRRRWRRRRRSMLRELRARFRCPLFVKPACLGSSVGISKVKTHGALARALDAAAEFDTKVLVEAGVDRARELECSVLGNEDPEASCVGEVIPGAEFYDYEEKYLRDTAKLVIPAAIPRRVAERVRRLALAAFRAADCAGLARVDFLMDRHTRRLYLSELNTMPGFTTISMYPKLWEHSGLSYPKLLDRLIALAFERHADREHLRVQR